MKIKVIVAQRGESYEREISVANRHVLEADEELYDSLKEWFGRQVYEAHKRELDRTVGGI